MAFISKAFGRRVGETNVVAVPVSFETGEIGSYPVYFPYPVQITGITATVTKAIAATDNGTITGANASGASASGVLTATASDPLGTLYAAVVPTTNNTVAANSYYKLTTAKATAGGKALVTLQYKRA